MADEACSSGAARLVFRRVKIASGAVFKRHHKSRKTLSRVVARRPLQLQGTRAQPSTDNTAVLSYRSTLQQQQVPHEKCMLHKCADSGPATDREDLGTFNSSSARLCRQALHVDVRLAAVRRQLLVARAEHSVKTSDEVAKQPMQLQHLQQPQPEQIQQDSSGSKQMPSEESSGSCTASPDSFPHETRLARAAALIEQLQQTAAPVAVATDVIQQQYAATEPDGVTSVLLHQLLTKLRGAATAAQVQTGEVKACSYTAHAVQQLMPMLLEKAKRQVHNGVSMIACDPKSQPPMHSSSSNTRLVREQTAGDAATKLATQRVLHMLLQLQKSGVNGTSSSADSGTTGQQAQVLSG